MLTRAGCSCGACAGESQSVSQSVSQSIERYLSLVESCRCLLSLAVKREGGSEVGVDSSGTPLAS
jgi:hypothetical protein